MVNAVSVVPEDAEVLGGRLESGKALNDLVRIGYAGGVRVHGNAPDALDRVVLCHQLFDHVHIGAVFVGGDVYHLKAELLGDSKVPVIAGNRAEPLYLGQILPRLLNAVHAENVAAHYHIVHYIKAGVSADDKLVVADAQHGSEKVLSINDAVQTAVVAAVGAVRGLVVLVVAVYGSKHFHSQIKLLAGGLASCHVERKAESLIAVILCFDFISEFFKLFLIHFTKLHHKFLRLAIVLTCIPYHAYLRGIMPPVRPLLLYTHRREFASCFCLPCKKSLYCTVFNC